MRERRPAQTSLFLPGMKKRIAVSVSNDLVTDRRVQKQCDALRGGGFDLLLLGRQLPDSGAVDRPYAVKRFRLIFNRKALFYAELNLRIFFFLLFRKADLFYANDLDTLPANTLLAVLRRKPLVYDSHEFFTEVPDVKARPAVQKVWKMLERLCIPRANHVLTVNGSLARLFEQTYGIDQVGVVRNVPDRSADIDATSRAQLGLPENLKILILQGSGINRNRGAEELLSAVALTRGVLLLIVGSGDALPDLKKRAARPDLFEKVKFLPRMPYPEMMRYTACADLGVSFDKDAGLNQRYSLPNKVFDYAAAGVPMLVSDLPEVRAFVTRSGAGVVAERLDAKYLAELITRVLGDEAGQQRRRQAAKKAAEKLNWSEEYAPTLSAVRALSGMN